jgi:HAE1 family hydrophobic/amphiphilic exporter-1
MGGLMGRLLFEFGMTITIAILLSGVVALTLTPMLASRMISGKLHGDQYEWQRRIEAMYQATLRGYDRSLQWTLRHHRITFSIFILSVLLASILIYFIPKGFLPSEDTGQLFAYTEGDSSISFTTMVERQQALAKILYADPNLESVVSSVGSGGASSSVNAGRFFLRLKPLAEREMTADEIAQSLRNKLSSITGISAYVQNVPSIRIGNLSKNMYQFTLQSGDLNELYKWADTFTDRMRKIPGLQDVTNDLQYTGPQINIKLLRDKMAAH